MDDTLSPQQAKQMEAREERGQLALRMKHACSHLSRVSFNQLIDAMMVMRSRDLARLALDSAS
jgi:hypothetical protein